LIYNPHPFKIKGIFECEFQLADQNYEESFTVPIVCKNGQELPTQNEKELSNLNLDWRKHPVFYAELEPSTMNRFDCKLNKLDKKPEIDLKAEKGKYIIRNERLEVIINADTGLLDKYSVDNIDFLEPNAFLPLVIKDNEDPWGMNVNSFRRVEGCFKLMDSARGSKYSGISKNHIESVRVIEDGAVRTVIEAVFSYEASFIVIQYLIPKEGTELNVKVRVNWNQKDSMLKLSIPSSLPNSKLKGQIAYGVENLATNGNEVTAQKWTAIADDKSNKALTCINNGIYGFDFLHGELRLSLLRSPTYSGHPINDRPIIPQDRFLPRIDQGERTFSFWINAGDAKKRLEHIDREALIHNETPFALSFFPSGGGQTPKNLISLSDEIIQLAAFKQSEDKAGYIIRLFNQTDEDQTTSISLLGETILDALKFSKYEIKSFKWNGKNITEVDLMEEPI
jgi:alpha-mannosidase